MSVPLASKPNIFMVKVIGITSEQGCDIRIQIRKRPIWSTFEQTGGSSIVPPWFLLFEVHKNWDLAILGGFGQQSTRKGLL